MRLSSSKPNLVSVGDRTFTLRAACARTHYGAPQCGIPASSGGTCYAYAFEARKGAKHLDDAWIVEMRSGVVGIVERGSDDEWTFQHVTERVAPVPRWMRSVLGVSQNTVYILSSRLLYSTRSLVECLNSV